MPSVCPSIAPEGAFVTGLLNYIDCQAQTLGEAGYRALASGSSSFSPLLSIALTIFVALIGYRLLLGDAPRSREGILIGVKFALVLMLATSWPAFRVIVYDVTMHGPADLAKSIGAPAGIPGSDGGLVVRLQNVDNALAELIVRGEGQPNGNITGNVSANRWIPFDPLRNSNMLAQTRTVYLVSTIGAFAVVRFIAGFLLALGPIFALFLLFDGTRGLFESWMRGLVGTAIGAAGVSIILGLELALIEPWIYQLLSARRAGIGTPAAPVELLVTSVVFMITLFAVLIAAAKIAQGIRIPYALKYRDIYWPKIQTALASRFQNNAQSAANESEERSRARAVADAVAATQRRESQMAKDQSSQPDRAKLLANGLSTRNENNALGANGSRTQFRRTRSRVSAMVGKRDQR